MVQRSTTTRIVGYERNRAGLFWNAGRWSALLCCVFILPIACTKWLPGSIGIETLVYSRVEADHIKRLEEENERLRADIGRAEEVLIGVESGLRGKNTRAAAVSSLVESRIMVEHAAVDAPWRMLETHEARKKLEEADRQIEQGNSGVALFFVYRARRIAELMQSEADMARARHGTSYINAKRVNLRAGPSTDEPVVKVLIEGTPVLAEGRKRGWVLVSSFGGVVGWVHGDLLRDP